VVGGREALRIVKTPKDGKHGSKKKKKSRGRRKIFNPLTRAQGPLVEKGN